VITENRNTGTFTLAALHVYPVKSCRGLSVDGATVTDAGLEYDREWMIVSPEGRFLTQRELPRLALVGTRLEPACLQLTAPDRTPLDVPLDARGRSLEVSVWRDRCRGIDQGDAAADWLSDFAGRPVRLVRFEPGQRRASDRTWTGSIDAYSRFSDGFALLAISVASLADLNSRLPSPLPMDRFRPNLVLDGLVAYGEDTVGDLATGDIRLRPVKPCARCSVTTVDQATGIVSGDEPLSTLKTYRWNEALRGVTFGQNVVVVAGAGARLEVGAALSAV
jgi:uncharacterized protein YcbX